MTDTPHLDALTERGRTFLGTRHAIMAGAMSWVMEVTGRLTSILMGMSSGLCPKVTCSMTEAT